MQLTLVFTAILVGLINVEAAFQNYTAAVLEYGQPLFELTNDTVEDNIDTYRQFLRIAMKQEVKLIVFPEYGLTNGPVNSPSKFAVEVPDLKTPLPYKNFLMEKLSDMAKEHKIYMVVNLIELYKGRYYKTDIVFDKTGVIVAKYQAINIGNKSPGITRGPVNQPDSVFDTDFGVRFGLVSGYDIPANISAIPRLANVSDIIITTSRTSYLPFQHSLSLQLGFAMANKVNVLAASLSRPDEGISGSGIYGADGTAYSMFIAGKPSTKQLVGKLAANQVHTVTPLSQFTPQSLGAARPDAVPEITKFTAPRSFSDKLYTTAPLNLSNPNIKSQVCHGKFCCNFEVNVTTYNKNDHYRFLAFQGSDKVGETVERLKICGVVACESDDATSCATRNTTTAVIFDGISVQYEESGSYVGWAQPVLLNKDLVPVTNSTFNVNFVSGNKNFVLSTKEPANVVLFGIMASGVDTLCFSLILTVIMSSVCVLLR